MPDISFQPRLIEAVMNGAKPGTVRQLRKHPIKPGDRICIVTGQRTKKYKRHGFRTCVKVYPIAIDCIQKKIWIDGVELIPIIKHWFCITDIQGPQQLFWDFFDAQRYQRPLVYICFDGQTQIELDEWLTSNKQPVTISCGICDKQCEDEYALEAHMKFNHQ